VAADTLLMERRPVSASIMGSEAALVCRPDRYDHGIERLRYLEGLWSRFLPNSDITRLNTAGSHPVAVAPETVAVLERAVVAWQATDGAFDPTLLGTLARLGYSNSRINPTHVSRFADDAFDAGSPDRILISPDRSHVSLPAGTVLDLGGIGKGYAADLVASELADDEVGALVEVGGDLRCAGPPPPGGWHIDVADPDRATVAHRIVLNEGGVATSTTRIRRWVSGGTTHHHLIDPATAMPASNGVSACTVIAGTAAWAEVFTKVAFTRPATSALATLEARGLGALITMDDGVEYITDAWKDFAR
jgi:thiamine biosynthesis lipoprotein